MTLQLAALLYCVTLPPPLGRVVLDASSPRLALGIAPLLVLVRWSLDALQRAAAVPLWSICAALFVLTWIGQFVGHAVEGRRPSFFQDLQFLLIGPLWLLADVYRRAGIRY